MAVRRPAPPRVLALHPGGHPATAEVRAAPGEVRTAPGEARTPLAPGPDTITAAPPPASAPAAAITATASSSPRRRRTTARRAVLVVGALAAAAVPVTAGALLRREPAPAPSAAPATAASPQAAAEPSAAPAGPFEDVAAEHPHAAAILWADENGVQPALTATRYAPQDAVTRGDVALALHRFAGTPPVPAVTGDAGGAVPALLTDLGEDPARATALLWMHGRGALWGDAELRIRPEEPASRDDAARMLAALLRPALQGSGITWEAQAPACEPGSALPDVAWLLAAGMAPPATILTDWAGDVGISRAELAGALHRADTVVAGALN